MYLVRIIIKIINLYFSYLYNVFIVHFTSHTAFKLLSNTEIIAITY